MSNLSEKRGKSVVNENCEEIKVPNKNNDDNRVENKDGVIRESSVDCDLNNKLNDDVCEEIVSDKLNQDCVGDGNKECLDNGNKECLDNNDKLGRDQILGNISCNKEDKQEDCYPTIPTGVNEIGDEVVVFDEELVELGSKKWELTLVGQLVGHTMSLPALNYHLRRMWSKFGYKEIVDNRNGKWLFKFRNEAGIVNVANQSPWMVNGKPLMAWTTKGISVVSSSIGRPLIIDSMTAYVCKNGVGITEYARVLVEIEASKGFKEKIELQYRDKNMSVKGSKTVKVTYDWKHPVCSHCLVFGHDHKDCKVRARTVEEITAEKVNVDKQVEDKKEDEFTQNNERRFVGNIRINRPGKTNYNRINNMPGGGYRRFTGYNNQQWSRKVNNEEGNNASTNKGQGTEKDGSVKANKSQDVEPIRGMNMLKDKIIVDKYLNIKMQPSLSVTKNWSKEMKNYFQRSWEADREKERNKRLDDMEGFVEDIEDVYEDEGIVAKSLVADELKGMERRSLWNELQLAKCITNGVPWVIMRDFNVTLKPEEHSAVVKDLVCESQIEDVRGIFKCSKKGNCCCYTLRSLMRPLMIEEKFISQKAKVDWLSEGDRNSAYFHKVVKGRRNRNRILNIINDVGESMEGPKIADEFVKHYEKLLGQATLVYHLDSLGNIFTNILSNDEAEVMVRDVTDHEIKLAIFSIDDSKSPGPDGYTTCFLRKLGLLLNFSKITIGKVVPNMCLERSDIAKAERHCNVRGVSKELLILNYEPSQRKGDPIILLIFLPWFNRRTRLKSLRVKNSANVQKVANEWGIIFKHGIVDPGIMKTINSPWFGFQFISLELYLERA
ncbi:RNA-directed DNA polymerase, eukaryota, reverse transcriptase zinc-binding domain protein [Tanacetum coccineum]